MSFLSQSWSVFVVKEDGGCMVIRFGLDGFRGGVTPPVLNIMEHIMSGRMR